MIRATFELEPPGSAQALAVMESTGMPGPNEARGRVVSDSDGRAVVELPDDNRGRNVPLLVSAPVAGEATEAGAFSRRRFVDLELPDGLLPGPAVRERRSGRGQPEGGPWPLHAAVESLTT